MRGVYPDLAAMEDLLRASDLAWTVLRPPRLTDGPLTGTYRTSTQANLRRGMSVSRADLAHAMLAALSDPSSVGAYLRVAT